MTTHNPRANWTTKDYEDHLAKIAKEVMKVDVQDGCIEGRKDFIKNHVGQDLVPNRNVVVVVKLPRDTEEVDDWEEAYLGDCPRGNYVELPDGITIAEIAQLVAESRAEDA